MIDSSRADAAFSVHRQQPILAPLTAAPLIQPPNAALTARGRLTPLTSRPTSSTLTPTRPPPRLLAQHDSQSLANDVTELSQPPCLAVTAADVPASIVPQTPPPPDAQYDPATMVPFSIADLLRPTPFAFYLPSFEAQDFARLDLLSAMAEEDVTRLVNDVFYDARKREQRGILERGLVLPHHRELLLQLIGSQHQQRRSKPELSDSLPTTAQSPVLSSSASSPIVNPENAITGSEKLEPFVPPHPTAAEDCICLHGWAAVFSHWMSCLAFAMILLVVSVVTLVIWAQRAASASDGGNTEAGSFMSSMSYVGFSLAAIALIAAGFSWRRRRRATNTAACEPCYKACKWLDDSLRECSLCECDADRESFCGSCTWQSLECSACKSSSDSCGTFECCAADPAAPSCLDRLRACFDTDDTGPALLERLKDWWDARDGCDWSCDVCAADPESPSCTDRMRACCAADPSAPSCADRLRACFPPDDREPCTARLCAAFKRLCCPELDPNAPTLAQRLGAGLTAITTALSSCWSRLAQSLSHCQSSSHSWQCPQCSVPTCPSVQCPRPRCDCHCFADLDCAGCSACCSTFLKIICCRCKIAVE